MTDAAAPAPSPDLVVGLGTSAGGLEALQAFFAALPPDTGLAFVVVAHLDPAGPNLVPELLGKATALPVAEARDGTRLAPDHVYVAPPQSALRLDGSMLRVLPASGPGELRGPIDAFFVSLAEARQSAAVAIVLSGSGTDGTLGLKAVSDAGGLTMAQDPGTARADGMPRNAAAFGPADRVLRARQDARRVAGLRQARPGPGRGWRGGRRPPADLRRPGRHLRRPAGRHRPQLQALQDQHPGPPRRPADADPPPADGRPVRRAARRPTRTRPPRCSRTC